MGRDDQRSWLNEGILFLRSEIVDQALENEIEKAANVIARDVASGGRGPRNRYHPLAEALARIDRDRNQSGGQFRSTRDTVQLGVLGQHLKLLKNKRVAGWRERADRLRSDDWESFSSAAFEIEVAALHVYQGRTVRFIEESHEKTPDLLVDDEIEVECKSLRNLTQRDENNREMWSQLQRKIWNLAGNDKSWYVEFETRSSVSISDVEWVISEMRTVLKTGSDREIVENGRRLRIVALKLEVNRDEGLELTLPADAPAPESFDVYKVEITGEVDDGKMLPHSGYVFALTTTEQSDWQKRVRRTFKRSRAQFSGDRAAVLFVELPIMTPDDKQKVINRVAEAARDEFRQTSTISAAAMCFLVATQSGGEEVFDRSVEFELNPNAKRAVPPAASYFKPR